MNTIDAMSIMIAIKMTMRWKFKDEKNELEPWSESIQLYKLVCNIHCEFIIFYLYFDAFQY